MSLMSAISSATSGLIATQAAIDVASRNIANASVEGYTRKVQTTSTRVIDGQAGAGKVEEVTRNVNEQLQRDVREQSAVVEELKVIADFLSRFELEFGRPEDNSSVAAKITELKEAFQTLATNPDQATAQNDVIRAADEVAQSIRSLSEHIRSEEHTSELQSLMRISYAVFCLKKTKKNTQTHSHTNHITHNHTHKLYTN